MIQGNVLNVTVLSYRRQELSIGLVADREAVPDLPELAIDLGDAFDELDKAVLC